jgi:dihydroxyacetone kinase
MLEKSSRTFLSSRRRGGGLDQRVGRNPVLELYLLPQGQTASDQKKIKIYKPFVGEFFTALEMAGFSVTLMKLDEEMKKLLEAPRIHPITEKVIS